MKNEILLKISDYSILKGDHIACSYNNDNITWSELEKSTNLIAHQIQKITQGKKQLPILIYNKRNITFIKYMIAILKCGCFYVPLEDSIPIERVKYIYKDVGACLLLTDKQNEFEPDLYNIMSLNKLETTNNTTVNVDIKKDDLVYVIYTSGTTGKPKGVKVRYLNLINLIKSFEIIVYYNFKETVSIGVLASFSFDASVKQIFCSLYYGHKLCIADSTVRNFSRKIHDFHNKNNLTLCDATPSIINLMTMQKVKNKSRISYMLVGGEILHWETLHKYIKFSGYKPIFINVYGPTECCVDVAYKIISEEDLKNNITGIVPIGKSVLNTKLTIRSEDGHVINDREKVGELYISGNQVGAGYVNIKSDCFFQEDGYMTYKTGDIAYFNKDDDIVVVGRNDMQVNINGNRIELQEIEKVIESYILCPCVVACVNSGISKKIVAYICKTQFNQEEKLKLRNYLKKKLPAYMIPQYFINGMNLPLNENGKIDYNLLVKYILKGENYDVYTK